MRVRLNANMRHYRKALKSCSRRLRSTMTDAEVRLWGRLRKRRPGIPFYRQKPLGPYVVDFFGPAAGLVIEVDGGQHFEDAGLRADAVRDAYLARMGLRVLRFTNTEVLLDLEIVLEVIAREIEHARGG